jgi:hypothetical protein
MRLRAGFFCYRYRCYTLFHSFSSILSFFSLYGEIVKRVTSDDSGTVEDPEGDTTGDENTTGGSSTGSETAGGGSDNTGGDPQNPGDGDDGLDQD